MCVLGKDSGAILGPFGCQASVAIQVGTPPENVLRPDNSSGTGMAIPAGVGCVFAERESNCGIGRGFQDC
jgi:hypothetical protein